MCATRRANRELWEEVAARGAIFSEAPLGVAPDRWRFPARNRLIAGLADAVVVVESHARGGSLYTVESAAERDRPVLAVPGSIRSSSSEGTNALLADGCAPVRGVDDVIAVLGISTSTRPSAAPQPKLDDPADVELLDTLGSEPSTVDLLVLSTGYSLDDVSQRLERLRSLGLVAVTSGWWERVWV